MSRVTPRRAREVIAKVFPWAARGPGSSIALRAEHCESLGIVLTVVEEISAELLPSDADDFTTFVAARGAIRSTLQQWAGGAHPGYLPILVDLPIAGGGSPITVLYQVLGRCPEEATSPATAGLEFVQDRELREQLRRDLSGARSALNHGEFKAATVLAGSVIEALRLVATTRCARGVASGEIESTTRAVGPRDLSRHCAGTNDHQRRNVESRRCCAGLSKSDSSWSCSSTRETVRRINGHGSYCGCVGSGSRFGVVVQSPHQRRADINVASRRRSD